MKSELKKLEKELKELGKQRDEFLEKSKTSYLLYHRNQAKANYNQCLLDMTEKRRDIKNLTS